MNRNTFEAIVGVVILIVSGFFLYHIYTANGASGTGYVLKARFDRIDGITIGSDVKISGVKVGTVSSFQLDSENYQALVSFDIQDTVRIPADSSAQIVSESLLGGKYVAISPGAEAEMIPPQGIFRETLSSVNLESLLAKFVFSANKDEKSTSNHN